VESEGVTELPLWRRSIEKGAPTGGAAGVGASEGRRRRRKPKEEERRSAKEEQTFSSSI